MSWLKENGYNNIEEFMDEYTNNNFSFPEWAETTQYKYFDKMDNFKAFSSGYYRFAFLKSAQDENSEQLQYQIKFLWPKWKEEQNE